MWATTLVIKEVQLSQASDLSDYDLSDYAELLLLFALSVAAFIGVFFISAELAVQLKQSLSELTGQSHATGFVVESLRLIAAVGGALLVARVGLLGGLSNSKMVDATYVTPIKELFHATWS